MNGENEKNVGNSRGSGRNAWRVNGLCLQDYPGAERRIESKGLSDNLRQGSDKIL